MPLLLRDCLKLSWDHLLFPHISLASWLQCLQICFHVCPRQWTFYLIKYVSMFFCLLLLDSVSVPKPCPLSVLVDLIGFSSTRHNVTGRKEQNSQQWLPCYLTKMLFVIFSNNYCVKIWHRTAAGQNSNVVETGSTCALYCICGKYTLYICFINSMRQQTAPCLAFGTCKSLQAVLLSLHCVYLCSRVLVRNIRLAMPCSILVYWHLM